MVPQFSRWRWGWAALSMCLLVTPVACAADESTVATPPPSVSSAEEPAFQQLLSADIVYLGERHDSVADHGAQLEIIASLYAANPDLAIALEMFQRPFQPVIDRYLAGEISEAELVEQTQYRQRWGFPWEYYAPFLRFAQAHQLPVLALNAPSEITRQVAREGLDSLAGDDWRYIPPLEEIDTSNTDYQDFVRAAFGSHGSHGNFNFENFFAAQVIWDETMAMTIAEFKQAQPDTQVVVLAGNGHVVYGYGIPDRVARRLGEDVTQQIVLLNPIPALAEAEGAIADMFWYSREP
jgi:uncharacterized iron-regulated protein